MKREVKIIARKSLRFLFHTKINRVRWIKSLYFNLKLIPFSQAVKLPVLIYENITLGSLGGKIIIKGIVHKGMIKIGYNSDRFAASKGGALLDIGGTIIFNGSAVFSVDCTINVSKNCVLEIGEFCGIGNGVKIICWKGIKIGAYTRIAVESLIFDTNFHYTRNINTGQILPMSTEILIGKSCWIGNRTSILKGTVLPDYTIVASNSLLNKNYDSFIELGSVIGGLPSKLITTGQVRVFSTYLEEEIHKHFTNNTDVPYIGPEGITDETNDIRRFFNSLK